jgi:hypothetical protein
VHLERVAELSTEPLRPPGTAVMSREFCMQSERIPRYALGAKLMQVPRVYASVPRLYA